MSPISPFLRRKADIVVARCDFRRWNHPRHREHWTQVTVAPSFRALLRVSSQK
jgi:hypothetical protein